ncbi:MAG: hypothetical protein PHV43_02150 [Candidatus Colwellbacteria bacterium]|nr:hypothetical protein [Candidatus Colwellbacteria bacterium]
MKKTTTIVVYVAVLAVFAVAIIWWLYRGSVYDNGTFILLPVGDGTESQMVMIDGTRTFLLEQGYALAGMNVDQTDTPEIQSLKVKYPQSANFMDANTSGDTEGAALYLPVWPSLVPGDYSFQIKYEDSTTVETVVPWDQPKEIIAQATEETDAVKGVAYRLGNLDLTSFEQAYHIRPSGSALKIESSGDSYFWLKDSAATPGEHIILVKQDSIWYAAKIDVGI